MRKEKMGKSPEEFLVFSTLVSRQEFGSGSWGRGPAPDSPQVVGQMLQEGDPRTLKKKKSRNLMENSQKLDWGRGGGACGSRVQERYSSRHEGDDVGPSSF